MVLPIVIAVIAIATYFFTQSKSTARIAVKQVESNERIDKLKKEIKSKEKKGRERLRRNDPNYLKYQKKSKEKSSKDTKPKLTNKELKEKLSKVTYKIKKGSDPNNPQNYKKTFIDLENYALDFNKRYEYVKITKSGNVVLKSSHNPIKKYIAKIKYDEGNKEYNLNAEGSRYSITL
tara:strand:+ start:1744 stop:2274 length:531 start_codon:yes stop_codon:yes gene_type:complete